MKIALVHPAVIPPRKYGGTERIVYWLMVALRSLGHQVVLVSAPGGHEAQADDYVPYDENWETRLPPGVDLVHLWSTPGRAPRLPCVVTIQGNGKAGEEFHRNSVFVSRKHAENHGSREYVYNGIAVDEYPYETVREDRLVFLAKAAWSVKNLKGAIAVARAAGRELEVLGSRDLPWDLHRWIPRLRGVKYHGMVDDVEKRAVLRRAKALLFPVRWHEPFGIAITEALASGCAVLATPYGSLPEIVTPDCGLLSSRAEDHVRKLRGEWTYTPQRCRARVGQGFTHLEMGKAYLDIYGRVLSEGRLADVPPRTREGATGLSSASLLPWAAL